MRGKKCLHLCYCGQCPRQALSCVMVWRTHRGGPAPLVNTEQGLGTSSDLELVCNEAVLCRERGPSIHIIYIYCSGSQMSDVWISFLRHSPRHFPEENLVYIFDYSRAHTKQPEVRGPRCHGRMVGCASEVRYMELYHTHGACRYLYAAAASSFPTAVAR